MTLTKEEFREQLKRLQHYYHKQDKFCTCLEDITNENIIPAFIYTEPMNDIIVLLVKMFNDKNDDINYFLYELDAIDSDTLTVSIDKCPEYEDGSALYHDVDSLYDYLSKNNC